MEEEVEDGRMEGVELLFLTDNFVVEAMYYRQKSRDKDIFELILWLVYLELRGCFRFYIIWLSGTREISAGIDGFSGGCLTYGIALYGSI